MKRLLLISLILMWAMPSWATYYVVGNSPIGNGFSPDKGKAMTEHPDGTYTLGGQAISNPHGLYIEVKGNQVEKKYQP